MEFALNGLALKGLGDVYLRSNVDDVSRVVFFFHHKTYSFLANDCRGNNVYLKKKSSAFRQYIWLIMKFRKKILLFLILTPIMFLQSLVLPSMMLVDPETLAQLTATWARPCFFSISLKTSKI